MTQNAPAWRRIVDAEILRWSIPGQRELLQPIQHAADLVQPIRSVDRQIGTLGK